MNKNILYIGLIKTLVFAHQPVMDMAPRWSGGYGFQIRYESFKTKHQDKSFSTDHRIYFFEGVYTWDKSKRITFKLPYYKIENRRSNSVSRLSEFRELIIGLPLKKYKNYNHHTQNFGFTPQIKIPINKMDRSSKYKYGSGLSISYSKESFKYYQLYDIFGWIHQGKVPLFGIDINLGVHPYHNNNNNNGVFIIWDVTGRYNESHGSILAGPVLVPYRQKVMARLELKFPVIETGIEDHLTKSIFSNLGIGFVF